jgi:hypothetical protein
MVQLKIFTTVFMMSMLFTTTHSLAQIRIYPLDGNANEIINGQNGILGTGLNAPIDTTDRFGTSNSAYYFDGNRYIDIPVPGLLNNTFSVSAWVTIDSLPVYLNDFFGVGDNIADQAFGVGNDINGIGFFHAGYTLGGGNLYVYTDTVPQTQRWYHYVVTRSPTVVKLFIDGILVDTASTLGNLPDYGAGTHAVIGCRSTAFLGYQGWIGKIDDVRFYDYALPDTSVITSQINSEIGAVKNTVNIYPNPASNRLFIDLPNNSSGNIVVLNLFGDQIFEEIFLNESKKEINLTNIAAGIYFVKVFHGEKLSCKKVIVYHN